MKNVGSFTYDPSTSTVTGPADYMAARGSALLDRILAGTDYTFNTTASYSPDTVTAILVRLQTDYAGWKGTNQLTA